MSATSATASVPPTTNRCMRYTCCFQNDVSLRTLPAPAQKPGTDGDVTGGRTRVPSSAFARRPSTRAIPPTVARNPARIGTTSGVIERTTVRIQPATRTVTPSAPSGIAASTNSSVRLPFVMRLVVISVHLRGRPAADLDVEPRQPLEAARQVPVPASQQLHGRRQEHAADERRVEDHRDGEPDAHLLDVERRERREDREHRD